MIPDWAATDVLVADTLPRRFERLFRQLSDALHHNGIPLHVVNGTRDIWIRDYSPVQVGQREFVQFRYQPDYLRGHERLTTPPEVFAQVSSINRISHSPLVVDGGNVVGSQENAILTDKVLTENRKLESGELQLQLQILLRVHHVVLIPQEPGDVVGHADGMVRFLDESTVLVNDYSRVHPKFGRRLEAILRDRGFKVERFPYVPDLRSRKSIPSAVGNYVNFLRVGPLIILPCFNLEEDKDAESILTRLLPSTCVLQINCIDLARDGGVLNCATSTFRQCRGNGPEPI